LKTFYFLFFISFFIAFEQLVIYLSASNYPTMLSLEFSMSFLMLSGIVGVSVFLGFILRSRQLGKSKMKLAKVENELISSHAEILELQKEYMALELKLRGVKDNVVLMRNTSLQADNTEKLPNVAIRKKMIGNENQTQPDNSNIINQETRVAK
jgi:hypothetical protein